MHGNQPSRSMPDEETPLILNEQGRSDSEHGITQQPTTQSMDEAKVSSSGSWVSMPNKGQLAVIMLVRLAEPISERSLTAYLFYQLQWFDKSLDASSIAKQAGHLTAAFAASQCVTSMWWGRAADSPVLGRKGVLIIGLLGSAVSALGMGFSTTYRSAMLFRMLAGALNGNVAVLRTMVSEVVVDNRYRSRAFLLLPMCFNVGNIVGPLMSGVLANPIDSLPGLFGPGSFFGGCDGVQWMSRFPYALPNVVCALLLITSALGVIFALGETHPLLRHDKPGQRRRFREGLLVGILKRRNAKLSYQCVATDGTFA
ncbi:hypothetical protein FALCPG4_010100 [Fusarium falciforme]